MNEALLQSSLRQHELVEQARNAEAAARTSEQQYRALFDSAPMAVFACDRNAVIQQYNAQAANLWGREPVCGVERHCGALALWHLDGTPLPHAESPVVEVLATGVPRHDVEILIERPDGSRRPVLVSFAPLKNAHGEVTGAITSFVDITTRRHMEDALRHRTAQFQALLHAAPLGVYLVDADFRIREANPVARSTFGIADLIGRDFDEAIHSLWLKPYADEIVAIFRHTLETGEPHVVPERIETRADLGTTEYYEWQVDRLTLPDGRYGVVCYFRDISERVLARASLAESEIRYRRLFQTAKDGVLILDVDTRKIIDANACMAGLLAQAPSTLIGKELHEIGVLEDERANKAAFSELIRTGYIRYENLPIQNVDGDVIPVEFVSNVYREEDRLLAQCHVRDISARVAMQREIHHQADSLAVQARRKDEFLAMLSHELRNPLGPIRNATHLLKLQEEGNENPIQQQARQVIERQVASLTKLVDDLLEISRVVSGKIRLDRETIDLRAAVEHALKSTLPLIERQHHEVSLALPDEPVWVSADATRVEQVAINLLTNAAKFTDRGGHIWVSVEPRPDYALLCVRDSGVGIAPEMLDHVFDLFAQADRSLARSQGGLGIGLSLVKKLVELHGGTAEAKSAGVGHGSEFVVSWPVAPAPGARPTLAPVSPDDQVAKGLRVLVVDDNEDGCTTLAMLLGVDGYRVQTAFNGPDAIAAATSWRPDVALLDIGLPDIDGFEVARRLRAHPATNSIKLVAVSGYGSEKDIALGREAGFDKYLVKPLDLDEVVKLLAVWNDEIS